MFVTIFQDDGKIRFNFDTTVRYAFINPQMILDEDGSLIIRHLKLKDSGTYLCGEKSDNGLTTILKVIDANDPIVPSVGQEDTKLKEKQPINNLPDVSNKQDKSGETLDNEKEKIKRKRNY